LLDHGVQAEALIGPITEFGQATGQAPVAGCLTRPMKGVFNIAQNAVEPFKHAGVDIAGILTGGRLVVSAARCRYSGKTILTIRKDRDSGPDIFDTPDGDPLQCKRCTRLHCTQVSQWPQLAVILFATRADHFPVCSMSTAKPMTALTMASTALSAITPAALTLLRAKLRSRYPTVCHRCGQFLRRQDPPWSRGRPTTDVWGSGGQRRS